LGNLVLVSRLRAAGSDPRAIRLALLAQHYRTDWEWTAAQLADAEARLAAWTSAFAPSDAAGAAVSAFESAAAVVERMRAALVDDLDTRGALAAVDEAVAAGVDDRALIAAAIDALLGVKL
jgi:L-cysteine:1D-myo-inositol 2-amino-2-deoxy-alpha-D-glucopyranoside ligase